MNTQRTVDEALSLASHASSLAHAAVRLADPADDDRLDVGQAVMNTATILSRLATTLIDQAHAAERQALAERREGTDR